MYDLSVKNASGDILRLTRSNSYAITGVTGLTPVAANINTSTAGINDGVLYNSARLDYRNIVLTIRFTQDVEKNRIRLYNYFQTKQFCTLYFSNDTRDVYISGYVETFECDLFTLGQSAQISIICPNPYFKNVSETVNGGSAVTAAFEFPKAFTNVEFSTETANTTVTIPNNGDISAGMDIAINFTGNVSIPVIRNAKTGEFFRLNRDFVEGDKISINTRNGEKSVTLTRLGVDFNIINSLDAAASWLQLRRGNNDFYYSASSGGNNMQITFTHTDLFAGV